MALSVVSQSPACLKDLTLLAASTRVGTLVVAAKQEDQPLSMCMTENPEQDTLAACFRARGLAYGAQDLSSIVPEAELEQTVAELLAIARPADPDAFNLQDLVQRDADGSALGGREFLTKPAQDRLASATNGAVPSERHGTLTVLR